MSIVYCLHANLQKVANSGSLGNQVELELIKINKSKPGGRQSRETVYSDENGKLLHLYTDHLS